MKHFTKNTISAVHWCNRCRAHTPHSVSGGRMGSCLTCMEKAERLHQAAQLNRRPEPEKQEALKF